MDKTKRRLKVTFSFIFTTWSGRLDSHITRRGNKITQITISLANIAYLHYPSRGIRGYVKALSDVITHEYTHYVIDEIGEGDYRHYNWDENIEYVLDELLGTKYIT